MALKSLAFTKAEQKERTTAMNKCVPYDGDKYPWGMRLDFNNDVMKKLDVDTLPKTGSEITLRAKAKVISTSVNIRDGETEKRMELQLVALELELPEETAEDAIERAIAENS